VAELAYALD